MGRAWEWVSCVRRVSLRTQTAQNPLDRISGVFVLFYREQGVCHPRNKLLTVCLPVGDSERRFVKSFRNIFFYQKCVRLRFLWAVYVSRTVYCGHYMSEFHNNVRVFLFRFSFLACSFIRGFPNTIRSDYLAWVQCNTQIIG